MLTYEELKNKPREMLAATGLKQDEFGALLEGFAKSDGEQYPEHETVEGHASWFINCGVGALCRFII